MSTINVYRENAQECLRVAEATRDDSDRHLWITMAHSWMRLADQIASSNVGADYRHVDESAG